jgi:hypothetical protein
MWPYLRGWVLSSALVGCAAAVSPPAVPFRGVEDGTWLVRESEATGRDDLLPAFEESARAFGCDTMKLGSETSQNMFGERTSYFGVSASCETGTIAIITLVGGHVRIGCSKPTTPAACDQLLRDISEAR